MQQTKFMEKNKEFTRKKKFKIWNYEIELIVQQNILAFKKYLQRKTIDTEIQYNRRRVVAKTEIRKRHLKYLEEFTSHLESAIYKMKLNIFKILKHMKKDIKESTQTYEQRY